MRAPSVHGCASSAWSGPSSLRIRGIVTVLAIVLLIPSHVNALKLKFRTEECLQYHFHMYHSFYGSFVALPDTYGMTGRYMLTITSPAGVKVYESSYAHEDKFNVVPYETGNYNFCLHLENARSLSRYIVSRDVIWDLHTTGADNHHDHVKEGETKQLWDMVALIDSQVQQLKSTQQYLYWRERRHRQTVDSTNARVLTYAVARNLALIASALGQVLFIRRMFSQ